MSDQQNVSQGPVRERDPNAETKARALLRQATWEVTQFMAYDDVRDLVDSVLDEVESDEP